MKLLTTLLLGFAAVQASMDSLGSLYHTSDKVDAKLDTLTKSCKYLKVTKHVGPKGQAKLTSVTLKKDGGKEKKMKVLLFFGEHSRELVSVESGLSLIQSLCGGGNADVDKNLVNYNLDNAEFLIFTNIGVNSRRKVERGDYCLRVNENGVDLNRNWDDHWTKDGTGETNPGPHAFSEDETSILRDSSKAFAPDLFLTVHSGILGMYIPYAFSQDEVQGKTTGAMLEVLHKLNPKYCNCDVGAAGKQVGYLCPGTCLDFIYDLGTKYSFAFEIYENGRFKRAAGDTALLETPGSCFLQKDPHPLAHDHSHQGHSHGHSHSHAIDKLSAKPDTPQRRLLATLRQKRLQALIESGEEFPEPREGMNQQCFQGFNPVTERQYKGAMTNWVSAYLELVQRVNEHHESQGF